MRERGGREGGKARKARVHERFATRPGSAMRWDTYDAMQCDLMAEVQRIDSALDSTRLERRPRAGRSGRERGCPLYFSNHSVNQSIINRQPSTDVQPLCTVPGSSSPKPQPQIQSVPARKSMDGTCPARDNVLCRAVLGQTQTDTRKRDGQGAQQVHPREESEGAPHRDKICTSDARSAPGTSDKVGARAGGPTGPMEQGLACRNGVKTVKLVEAAMTKHES